MSDGAITDNSVPDTASLGGGIYNDGQVTLTRVQVENNTTGPPYGGGIYTDDDGTTTVTYSTIAENHSAFGGGFAGTGALSVTDSLIRGNTASDGGGAWIVGCNPTTFQYDTFSGNGAGTYGGAVRDIGASIFLFHDKVADNVAGQLGGGLATAESNCPAGVDFRDTIMAGNQTSAGLGMDCVDTDGNFPPGLRTGDNISDGHNIIGDAAASPRPPATGSAPQARRSTRSSRRSRTTAGRRSRWRCCPEVRRSEPPTGSAVTPTSADS